MKKTSRQVKGKSEAKGKSSEKKGKDYMMRHGLKWDKQELNDLIEELKADKDWKEIAQEHKRSEKSVKGKARQHFMSMRKKDQDTSEMSEETGVSVEIIDSLLKDDTLDFKKEDTTHTQLELLTEMTHLQERMVELMEAWSEKYDIKPKKKTKVSSTDKNIDKKKQVKEERKKQTKDENNEEQDVEEAKDNEEDG